MKKKVVCSKCGYEQNTKSKLDRVTCSNCGLKIKLTEEEIGTTRSIKPSGGDGVYDAGRAKTAT